MSYDPACEDLARHFLADADRDDEPLLVEGLAQTIQHAIEQWLEGYLPKEDAQ